jgi:hypothetical protein
MRPRFFVMPLLALPGVPLVACTSWTRLPPTQPTPPPATMQVWRVAQVLRLERATVTRDSIVGWRTQPDTARVALARTEIDSIRVQQLDPGKVFMVSAGVGLAAFLLWSSELGGLKD